MPIEKLKGVITHSTLDAADRAGMLCQCQVCGKTAVCREGFDFYASGMGQPLACEACVVGKGIKAPWIDMGHYDYMKIAIEQTRAACAQIAARVMVRELALAVKNPGRLAYSTFGEEIRDRILMAPESQNKEWRKLEAPEIEPRHLHQENLFEEKEHGRKKRDRTEKA